MWFGVSNDISIICPVGQNSVLSEEVNMFQALRVF